MRRLMMTMRSLFPAAMLGVLALACGAESSNAGGGGADGGDAGHGGDAGVDANPNPCAGLGCASMPGPLDLHVVDGSSTLVASPVFVEAGRPISATCVTDAGFDIQDAGATCDLWRLRDLSEGPHTITVSAPGFAPQTVSVTIQGPLGCCGIGPTVDASVTLARGGDAGSSDGGDGG